MLNKSGKFDEKTVISLHRHTGRISSRTRSLSRNMLYNEKRLLVYVEVLLSESEMIDNPINLRRRSLSIVVAHLHFQFIFNVSSIEDKCNTQEATAC